MTTWYINSNNGTHWQAAHAYISGDICVCAPSVSTDYRATRVYECTVAGTSHGTTEPTFNTTVGGTTADNEVTWTTRNPTSWLLAHPSLVMCLRSFTFFATGDIFKVHNTHNESISSTDSETILYFKGTYNNPNLVVCVDKDNSDALSTGAVVIVNKATKYLFGYALWHNVKLDIAGVVNLASGSRTVWTLMGNGANTVLKLSGAASYWGTSSTSPNTLNGLNIINGDVELVNADNYIGGGNFLNWKGGSLISPVDVTNLINATSYGKHCIRIENVNLVAVGAGGLIKQATGVILDAIFSKCKLPSNLGSIVSDAFPAYGYGGVAKLHSCSYDQKTHGFGEYAAEGSVTHETSIVRIGGASDGITSVSWKLVTSAAVNELSVPLYSPSINLWNDLTSEITLTIHGILDSATNLQSDEVWLEVSCQADATSGLGTFKTTKKIYEGIVDLTASTETWIEELANPNLFKLSATFTPAQAGPIAARVCLGKASTTIYVCPKVVIG